MGDRLGFGKSIVGAEEIESGLLRYSLFGRRVLRFVLSFEG